MLPLPPLNSPLATACMLLTVRLRASCFMVSDMATGAVMPKQNSVVRGCFWRQSAATDAALLQVAKLSHIDNQFKHILLHDCM